jgi:serine/threonine-protein kinase
MEEAAQSGAPTRLGRYELVMKIASGGMATVYLGRMLSKGAFQKSVAIKVLHPELARDPGFVAMFLDEARLSAQIHHSNVVDVYDVDAEDGHLFIVMQYVEGASLFDLMRLSRQQKKVLPRGITLRIVIDALRGLDAAHSLTDGKGRPVDIVHRDVSPQNLLVSTDGVTRVSDFGVAKSAGRIAVTGSNDLVKGKLRYLAPEQMQRGADLDRRVDVFAGGIILWEALTWRSLFGGDTYAETLAAALTQPISPPSKFAVGLDPAIDEVCLKALERDRSKRFASAGAFADALEAAAGSLIATPKIVGKYVEELAKPTIDRSRSAMKSSHDLVLPLEEVASLTPSGVRPPRRLTPLGTPAQPARPVAVPRPGAMKLSAQDDVPTKLQPPRHHEGRDDDDPPTRLASPTDRDEVPTKIAPTPVGDQDDVPTRIATGDADDVATRLRPPIPAPAAAGEPPRTSLEPEIDAPTRVAAGRGTQPMMAPHVDGPLAVDPAGGLSTSEPVSNPSVEPQLLSQPDGALEVPSELAAVDDARRKRTRMIALGALGLVALVGVVALALGGSGAKSTASAEGSAKAAPSAAVVAAKLPDPAPAKSAPAASATAEASGATTASAAPEGSSAPASDGASSARPQGGAGQHPPGGGKLPGGKTPGNGHPKPPPTYVP